MSKKLGAKEMKSDPIREALVGISTRGVEWLSENRKTLLQAAAGIVVLALLVGAVSGWMESRRERANVALADALGLLEEAEAPSDSAAGVPAAPKPSWTAIQEAFGGVAEQHSGTAAGVIASYYAGIASLRDGQNDRAAQEMQAFVDGNPDHVLTPQALGLVAVAQEAAGNTDAAAQTLQRRADTAWPHFPHGAALIDLADLHRRQGDLGAAREIYETLTTDERFKESPYSTVATARLSELDASS